MTDVEVNNLALTSAIAAHEAAAKHDDAGFDTAEVLEAARRPPRQPCRARERSPMQIW